MAFNSFPLQKLFDDVQGINPAIFTMVVLKTSLKVGWHSQTFHSRKPLRKLGGIAKLFQPHRSLGPWEAPQSHLHRSPALREGARRGCHRQTSTRQRPRPPQELPSGAQPAAGTRSTEGSQPSPHGGLTPPITDLCHTGGRDACSGRPGQEGPGTRCRPGRPGLREPRPPAPSPALARPPRHRNAAELLPAAPATPGKSGRPPSPAFRVGPQHGPAPTSPALRPRSAPRPAEQRPPCARQGRAVPARPGGGRRRRAPCLPAPALTRQYGSHRAQQQPVLPHDARAEHSLLDRPRHGGGRRA